MTPIRRLLLLPLLAPLLAVLLVAALNPSPRLSLRLLVWRSVSLPLGAWLAMAASGGALISAGAASLALGQSQPLTWTDRRRSRDSEAPPDRNHWRRRTEPEPWDAEAPTAGGAWVPGRSDQVPSSAGPSRPVGEPAPTVAVPFRVIQRPSTPANAEDWRVQPRPAPASAPGRSASGSAPADDGEDWGTPAQEEW